MRNNSVVTGTTQGLIVFPHLTMQVKTASNETTTKPQPVMTDNALTIPPTTRKTMTAFDDHPSKLNTTETVTPLEKFTETASLLSSHSMSTLIDKRMAVRVTNTTSNSASTLECMWLCAAIQFQRSTHRWLSQHRDWFSLKTRTKSHGRDTSKNPGRYPNNTYRGDHVFLGCRWWRTIFFTQADNNDESEEQTLERKEQSKQMRSNG